MGKLKIIDDLIAPSDRVKIRFTGQNPSAIMGMVPDMIKNVMKIPGKDLLETDIRWDITDGSFYGVWMGKRTDDLWTRTFIRVIVQGIQNKEGFGDFSAEIKGTLETGYNFANFIQRSYWWFYNYGFYYKQRRGYLENGKDDIMDMKSFLLAKFKIAQED
ncbi:MAG: hypothetical protein HY517_03205 [Candidatus Aenigmarchaeota archaeon]|nr:hypothetical protein [Candidatus Aenigmarchaeota archaeon]